MVEQNMITTALKEYNVPDAAISKYREDFMSLSVNGVDDKEGYDLCHSARMEVKGKRVEVEKTRKKLKEDALEYGRAVDKEAKRITALLEPIENYLLSQEKIVDDEKARIKAEAEAKEAARIQARIDKLFAFDCVLLCFDFRFFLSLFFGNSVQTCGFCFLICPDFSEAFFFNTLVLFFFFNSGIFSVNQFFKLRANRFILFIGASF